MLERPDLYAADWFIRKGGKEDKIGPFSLSTLARMWVQGNLVSKDLLFAEGILPQWVRAGQLQYLLVEDDSHSDLNFSKNSESSDALDTPRIDSDHPSGDGFFYLLEGEKLRGPITLQQIEMLLKWKEINPRTQVYDSMGKPLTTVADVLN